MWEWKSFCHPHNLPMSREGRENYEKNINEQRGSFIKFSLWRKILITFYNQKFFSYSKKTRFVFIFFLLFFYIKKLKLTLKCKIVNEEKLFHHLKKKLTSSALNQPLLPFRKPLFNTYTKLISRLFHVASESLI